jgi:hypothetical protein
MKMHLDPVCQIQRPSRLELLVPQERSAKERDDSR